MLIRRRIFAGIAIVLACEPGPGGRVRANLEQGNAAVQRWTADANAPIIDAGTAISLGYMERLRLGLGSPFRLADQAMQDPRLAADDRRLVAWAIMARTLARDAYHVHPAVLDHLEGPGRPPAAGSDYLDLIERTIRESPDPRTGESAVRIAFARAAADGLVDGDAPLVAARVAALIRDRLLARSDVQRMLAEARRTAEDPLDLLRSWRAERRFAVEAPVLRTRSRESDRRAHVVATRLGPTMRRIAARGSRVRPASIDDPVLTRSAALRLQSIDDSLDLPPQAPVVVTIAGNRSVPVARGSAVATRAALDRFSRKAVTEEAFAAGYGALAGSTNAATAGSLALSVAVALRAYAQEPVWFPGFPAPTLNQIEARHGLADIRFADDVPASWRSYSLHVIDLALTDLRRVLPAIDLRGLGVSISAASMNGGILALHDPRRRRLVLPATTAAGSIAHEIAHDLDWQIALNRYRVRGDYASDAVSPTSDDPLAVLLTDLARTPTSRIACSTPVPAAPSTSAGGDAAVRNSAHSSRPAEIFARNVEWFVAASLAEQGRSDGYLSSIQDEVLAGYGSASPPDAATGRAVVDVLDGITALDPVLRQRFLARYGGRTAGESGDRRDRAMFRSGAPRCRAATRASPTR